MRVLAPDEGVYRLKNAWLGCHSQSPVDRKFDYKMPRAHLQPMRPSRDSIVLPTSPRRFSGGKLLNPKMLTNVTIAARKSPFYLNNFEIDLLRNATQLAQTRSNLAPSVHLS